MNKETNAAHVSRRAELMAELFLQGLSPTFVAKSTTADIDFDFLVGFANQLGGIDVVGVEVKSTVEPVGDTFRLSSKVFKHLAYSNMPVLLLVVDVKANVISYAWMNDVPEPKDSHGSVEVPVRQVTEEAKRALLVHVNELASLRSRLQA